MRNRLIFGRGTRRLGHGTRRLGRGTPRLRRNSILALGWERIPPLRGTPRLGRGTPRLRRNSILAPGWERISPLRTTPLPNRAPFPLKTPPPLRAPDLLLKAAEALEIDPHDIWYVGDSRWDMQAATAGGMVPIGITTGATPADQLREDGARVTFEGLHGLLGLLASLRPEEERQSAVG